MTKAQTKETEQKPLIEVKDVRFSYPIENNESIEVLKGVTFDIYPNEYVAIIGSNGSGKSTLSQHLNGIIKPEYGDVFVNGLNTKDEENQEAIRKQIGMVFQHPDSQFVATIVEDDVAFGLENISVPQEEMEERIVDALRKVGMEQFRKKPPHQLSGGQKQRIAIAGIIAMLPKLIVLDEATSMLDTYGRKDILKVVRELNNQQMGIVTVTHHMSEVAEADRVIVLHQGELIMEGTPREVFKEKGLLQRLKLDIPQASQLADLIHEEIPEFPSTLIYSSEIIEETRKLLSRNKVIV